MSKFLIPANLQELNGLIAKEKYIIVDFTATWCGPCKMITPILEKQAVARENVIFVKVDVDDLADIAAHYEVRAMPTLFFFRDGQKVDEIIGAKPAEIIAKLDALTA